MRFFLTILDGNATQGMRVGDSLQWHAWYAWNAGVQYKVQTHRNGMSGMHGMWAYSAKFNAGMLTHRNGTHGMRGMLIHRNAWYASREQSTLGCPPTVPK